MVVGPMKKHTTMTRKGQVTVPIEIRRALGLKEGDKVVFTLEGNEVRLAPTGQRCGTHGGHHQGPRPIPESERAERGRRASHRGRCVRANELVDARAVRRHQRLRTTSDGGSCGALPKTLQHSSPASNAVRSKRARAMPLSSRPSSRWSDITEPPSPSSAKVSSGSLRFQRLGCP